MNGDRRRCVETIEQNRKGMPIWELCNKVMYILQDQLYWTPVNEKIDKGLGR